MKKILHLNLRFFFMLFVVGSLLNMTLSPGKSAQAQGTSIPPQINKSFTPINIPAGGVSRLDITIFNPNPFGLTNAAWTDNLPTGVVLANPVNLSNTCGGTVTGDAPNSNFLSLSGGVVPAQQGATPGECIVSVNVTSAVAGNHINIIPVGGLTATGGGFNITNTSEARATLRVGAVGAPTVSKSFTPSTVWAGQSSDLAIVITNNSSNPLTQASLMDTLPTNVTVAGPVTTSLSGCGGGSVAASANGRTVTLNGATIAANSTCTIHVRVVSSVQGAYTNTIPPGELDTAERLTNASPASAVLTVQAIGVAKAFSPGTISAGGTSTLTITLQNPTSLPYTNASVSDTLPGTELTVVLGSASTTCVGGTTSTTAPRTVSMTGGMIPGGSPTSPGTCTITVQVQAPLDATSTQYRNVIPVGALTATTATGQSISNLRPAAATIRVEGSTVRGTKSFMPNRINPGEISRLRIVLNAPSDTNLTGVTFTDSLPTGVLISTSSPATMSGCGEGAGATLTLGTTSDPNTITLTNGAIAIGGACMIEVSVISTVPGGHTNTVSSITNDQGRTLTSSFRSTLNVSAPTALSIEIVKGFNPVQVFGGAASTMTITLINPNSTTLTNISFRDDMTTLGTGLRLANPANLNVGTCGGALSGNPDDTSFSFSGGSLAPNTSCDLTLSVTMDVNGNLTNQIPAGAVTTTEGATNPQGTDASLTNLPGVSISKAFSPNPIPLGLTSVLTITIQNTSAITVTGMSVVDDLAPSGLQIVGSPAPVWTCNGQLTAAAGTQTIELTNGVLTGNGVCTIDVTVTGGTTGNHLNTIDPGAIRSVQNITNNQPAQDTLVVLDPGAVSPPIPPPDDPGDPGVSGRINRTRTVANQPAIGGAGLIPLTGFAPDVVTVLESSRPSYAATNFALEIPTLKLNIPIVGVPFRNGAWDVNWLWGQAGWLNKTAYPTFSGNSVITAHNVTSDGKPGPFARIKYLKAGDYIFVYFADYRYIYEVVSTSRVKPDDKSVFRHEETPWLTLVTCEEYDVKTGTYLKRVVVRSMLIDIDLK